MVNRYCNLTTKCRWPQFAILSAGDCSDISTLADKNGTLEPYIIISDAEENLEAYLIVDKQIIDQVSLSSLPYALMSAFFVYNIYYPKGCTNFYTFYF